MDAFDPKNSEFTSETENNNNQVKRVITSCEKLSIVESEAKDFDLFFLENTGFFNPIISEKLAIKLKKNKTKGILVIPIEEYTWSE